MGRAFGFLFTLQLTRRMRPGATLWVAIPCGSWVFLSRATTRRHLLRLKGSRSFEKVGVANRLAKRVMFLPGPNLLSLLE